MAARELTDAEVFGSSGQATQPISAPAQTKELTDAEVFGTGTPSAEEDRPGLLSTTGASLTQATLGIARSLFETPETVERITNPTTRRIEKTPGILALNPLLHAPVAANYLAKLVKPITNPIAEKIGESQAALPQLFKPFQEVNRLSQEADKATQEAIGGNFDPLLQVVKDPKQWSAAIANAAPSLYAAIKSGGSIPFIAWMEGMESAVDAKEHEKRTGKKISDEQFTQAVMLTAAINATLEKLGLDKIRAAWKVAKGPQKKVLSRVLNGAVETIVAGQWEGFTELAQQVNTNLQQKLAYDKDKNLLEGALQSYMGGTGSGTGAAGIGRAISPAAPETTEPSKTIAGKELTDAEVFGGQESAPATTETAQPETTPPQAKPSEVELGEPTSQERQPVLRRAFASDGSYVDTAFELADANEIPATRTEAAQGEINMADLGDAATMDRGAPVVGPGNALEGGNQQASVIKTAYETDKGQPYKQWLMDNAEQFGLPKSDIEAMDRPMLVRRRISEAVQRETTEPTQAPTVVSPAVRKIQEAISPITTKWKNGPTVNVVQSVSELPDKAAPHDVEGAYLADGQIYLVADNLPTAERAKQVLAHEAIGHAGFEKVMGAELPAVLSEIDRLEKTEKSVMDAARTVDKNQPGLDKTTRAKEIIAVMAENGVQNSVIRRVINAIRKFLREAGIDIRLDANDIAGFLRAAEKSLEKPSAKQQPAKQQSAKTTKYSRKVYTEPKEYQDLYEAALKTEKGRSPDRSKLSSGQKPGRTVEGQAPRERWHQETVVRGIDGRLSTVFRGSYLRLTEDHFAFQSLGHNTKHPTSGLGVWFTMSQKEAPRFGPTVESFYLDIRNPAIFKPGSRDLPVYDLVKQYYQYRERLRERGFDAIVLDMRDLRGTMHFAVFDPGQVIHTRPLYSRRAQEKSPTWFSALARSIESAKQTKASAAEWKAIIAKMEGVKKDEVEAVGLNEWLDLQKGSITKESILDFVRQNGVQVQEKTLSEESEAAEKTPQEWQEASDREMRIGQQWQRNGDENQAQRHFDLSERYQRYAEALGDTGTTAGKPKFSQWQLPGGENYREMLLTLPTQEHALDAINEQMEPLSQEYADLHRESREKLYTRGNEPQEWIDRVRANRDATHALEDERNRLKRSAFFGGHYAEPNILAHVRFNERTDADGKRVLFIEEVQSDWAQKGRKEGFRGSLDAARVFFGIEKDSWDELSPEQKASYTEDMNSRSAARTLIPSAPFVTKTESWAMLAMKRMIRYAAENGFDRVAWDQGHAQAERYDMSKQVDSILYAKRDDGTYQIKATKSRGGEPRIIADSVRQDKLADYVGKEVADKIANGAGEEVRHTRFKQLTGLDLKVGGEGMTGFYNKIVPIAVNKYVKRFGSKTQETKLAETASNDKWPIATEVAQGKRPVNSIDITPAMRDAVMQGQPLFSRKKEADLKAEDQPTLDYSKLSANPLSDVAQFYKRNAERVINWLYPKIGKYLGPLSDLPNQKAFQERYYLLLGNIAKIEDISRRIYDTFRDASVDDQRAAFNFLTNRNVPASAISDPTVRQHAVATKRLINRVGDGLVARGLLDPSVREKYRDQYLPRVYLKHMLGEEAFKQMGAGLKPGQMGYLKGRKDLSPDVRAILGEITDPAYLASRGVSVPMRDMAILDFFKGIAGTPRNQWVWGQHLVQTLNGPVSVFWLDAEAKRLRKQANFMQGQAKQDAINLAQKYESLSAPTIELQADVPNNFRQIPNTARYGALRGLWVRKEIHNMLIGSRMISDDASVAEKILGYGGWGTKVTQFWKTMKVPFNPPSQVRNFVSNMVLLHVSGMPLHRIPQRFVQAIQEIRSNGKHWLVAKKYGIKATTFTNQELMKLETELLEAMKQQAPSTLADLKFFAAKVFDAVGGAYQGIESIGKTMKIIDAMERQGMSEVDAVMAAQETLFDYSMVPKSIRYLRQAPIGGPFITFYYKALPMLIRNFVTAPHRFLPYILIPYLLAQMIADDYDVDDEDIKKLMKALPEWLHKRGHTMVLPFKDANGRWQVLDYGYFMPWGYFAELFNEVKNTVGKGKIGETGRIVGATGLLGGPIPDLIAAIKTNKDPFTKRDIVNKNDPPARQLSDLMTYLWRMGAPTWLTDIGYAGHTYRWLTGKVNPRLGPSYGEQLLTGPQTQARIVGINIYPIDPQKSRTENIRNMVREMEDVSRRMGQMARDPNLTPEQRRGVIGEYKTEIMIRRENLRQYQRESEVHPNLRVK